MHGDSEDVRVTKRAKLCCRMVRVIMGQVRWVLPLPASLPWAWQLNNAGNSLFFLTQPSICRFYAPFWLGFKDSWLLIP